MTADGGRSRWTVQAARSDHLPVVGEELTAAWLTEALSVNFPGVVVLRASSSDIMQGTATKIRIRADYNDVGTAHSLPGRFIVKGGFSSHRVLMASIYAEEMRFYSEIAARLPVRLPRCYYAGSNADATQSIVILEDLDLREVTFCRVERPMTFAQAARHLEAMALLHATWWDGPEIAPAGELAWIHALDPLPEGEAGTYQRGQLDPQVYPKFMALPRGVAVARIFHNRDHMQRALERLREIDRVGPHCFLHADFHLGNLYFDADGEAGILDWQSMRRGPWAHDFAYFLVSSLDMNDRREWEKPLLRHYLRKLDEQGIAAPAFPAAWDAYGLQIIYGLYYWLVNPIEFQAEVNNCAVAPRFALAALDHQTLPRLLG